MTTTGLNRNIIDKYYTKPEIATQCVNKFNTIIEPKETDIIIEPSAGGGAFIDPLRKLSQQVYLYDIQPENQAITQQDWLKWHPIQPTENIHIIGNPPFGRQSSTAIQFIKHSAKYAKTIAFILPKSFKKDSMRKAFPPLFHLVFEEDLPINSFTVNNESHDVPCVYQIWKKMDQPREIAQKIEPRGFEFVKKNQNPDISFRRVGVNAGVIDTVIETKSEQSHYFIRFTNKKSLEDNLRSLSNISFLFDNTVGPRSISKPELCEEFIKVL
jgi:hypothetical protein